MRYVKAFVPNTAFPGMDGSPRAKATTLALVWSSRKGSGAPPDEKGRTRVTSTIPAEAGGRGSAPTDPSQRELKHCAPPAPARELYQPPLPTLPNLTLRVLSEELSQRPENIATASLRRSPRPYDRKPSGKGHLTSELATAQGRTGQAASAGMQPTPPEALAGPPL